MKKKFNLKYILFQFLLIFIISCSDNNDPIGPIVGGPSNPGNGEDNGGGIETPFIYTPNNSLKSLASYPVGMIVSAGKLNSTSTSNTTFKEILLDDYNSITAENDMKMANMFTGPDTYDFSDGDEIVAYAKANGFRVHGHALIWHQSIPSWLDNFAGTDEEFDNQIEQYVKATVAHFATEKMTIDGNEVSVVASWDVVNEAIEGAGLRSTIFSQRLGADYVSKIFEWAREADPDVKLFYNDYNVAGQDSKRAAILNMISQFQTDGIPIDGIGLQMHINHNWPAEASLEKAINEVVATGLLIHFSELDIKVNYEEDITELTEERASAQEDMYKIVSEQYGKIPASQQFGITIWGMRDQDSWLYDGGKEWALMYDNDFNYKVAHRGFAQGLTSE